MLDVAILVPFQGQEGLWLEPVARRSQGPARLQAILARQRLARALDCDLPRLVPEWAAPHRYPVQRTAGAVALASSAERAGLAWHAVDPGEISLDDWRARLLALRARRPKLVAINSTFVNEVRWLHLFCLLVRRALPGARIALGGYFYATDARAFLASDADIFCVGEGEERFARIALAVRDGAPLDGIPGLYLKDAGGRVRSTGEAPPLDLEALQLPDWSLGARMDPPLDPARDPVLFHVETQRGCYFKCEFCTFRTLADRAMMSPERAAATLLAAGRAGRGRTFLADATATFPRDRWRQVLDAIEAAGGSPHPLSAFARVTDLDDEVCASMARVGVRHVFIGQESGDQAILNAMKKGTKTSQVRPALDTLGRHGVKTTFGFISGFPGEDAASAARSRELMLELNRGRAEPVVLVAYMDVFAAQDLAAVSVRHGLEARTHQFDYEGASMSAREAARQVLQNCIALARDPEAPVTGFGLTPLVGDLISAFSHGGDWQAGFRWLKAWDRGIAEFVQHELDGTPVDSRVIEEVRRALSVAPQRSGAGARAREHARTLSARALLREWSREPSRRPGILTRMLAASSVWQALGDARATAAAFTAAAAPICGDRASAAVRAERNAQAASLLEIGRVRGKKPLTPGARAAGA